MCGKPGSAGKEIILTIRGSKEPLDWAINKNTNPHEFTYVRSGKERVFVKGYVHKGMFMGAKGILEGFSMAKYLEQFVKLGFAVRVVGHRYLTDR